MNHKKIRIKIISITLSCRILKLKLKFIDRQNYYSFKGTVMSLVPKHCSYTTPIVIIVEYFEEYHSVFFLKNNFEYKFFKPKSILIWQKLLLQYNFSFLDFEREN